MTINNDKCINLSKGCRFGLERSCTNEENEKCGEGTRRIKLASEPCPVMTAYGYTGRFAKCDEPELRALVPADEPCCFENNCIRWHSKKIQTALIEIRAGRSGYEKLWPLIKETLAENKLMQVAA